MLCPALLWLLGLCSLQGSFVLGISQASILECVAIPFSRVLPNPGNKSMSLVLVGRFFTTESLSSVQYRCTVVSDYVRPHESQYARPPCPSPTPWVYSNSRPLSWWCHRGISSSVVPFSSCPQSFPASGSLQWVSYSHQVAKVLEFQHQSFQWTPRTDLLYNGLVGFPCSSRDSQESSQTPQFKSINFLVLSFLHSPTLTSIHDHRKNHSLDQTDLCWQSNVSAF